MFTQSLQSRTKRNRNHRHLQPELLESRLVLATIVDNLNDSGPGSLRQAILDTNAMSGADTIDFADGLSGTIFMTGGQFAITDELTINGPGDDVLTIDAQGMSRVFNIDDGVTTPRSSHTTLRSLTLTGGSDSGADGGGAIRVWRDDLTIEDLTISQSSSVSEGGGIFAVDSALSITDSTISGNSAGGGGGIFTLGAYYMSVIDSTISGNSAYFGGGVDLYNCNFHGIQYPNVSMTNVTISENTAPYGGGGIYSRQSTLSVTDSLVTGNAADEAVGGGILFFENSDQGRLQVTRSTISENSALFGGGIGGEAAVRFTLDDSTLSGNSATNDGGGFTGNATVTNSTISDNSAGRMGGGIHTWQEVELTNSTVSGNTAGGNGGGLSSFHLNAVRIVLNNSTVSGNLAGGDGGGIYQHPYVLIPYFIAQAENTILANNAAAGSGPDFAGELTADFSLIEDTSGATITGTNYISGMDPMLGPLQNNGGPTYTHALLTSSPAIDTGDPAAEAGVGDIPEFDQRGAPYGRVQDGGGSENAVIDMGAFEVQPDVVVACDLVGPGGVGGPNDICDIYDLDELTTMVADGAAPASDIDQWLIDAGARPENALATGGNPFLFGDANLDGVVDIENDFMTWNNNKFTSNTVWSAANFNGDSVTDGRDFLIWNSNKGESSNPTPVPASGKPHDSVSGKYVRHRDGAPLRGPSKAVTPAAIQRIDAVFSEIHRRDDQSEERPQAEVLDGLFEALAINRGLAPRGGL